LKTFITDPQEIESKSMQIITEELGAGIDKFDLSEAAVVKRVIHTTADFEYADLLGFSPGALDGALAAFIKGRQVVVTDTNMIATGINKKALHLFDGRVDCLVGEEETRQAAEKNGLTRSMINIRRAAEKYPQAIYAIGNAPTALYELLRLVGEKKVSPVLVVGVPVGFVEAEESKDELRKAAVPHIIVRGRKGGSPVAVAIINALLKLAAQKQQGAFK